MPSDAKALLKVTEHVKATDQNVLSDGEYSVFEEEEEEEHLTFINESPSPASKNFKQRLERILDSPIRKPDEHHIEFKNKIPIPMPRKRVMFNQPEVQKNTF
ncbi:hypothetical protein EVAR_72815_1 [Eumeta japonica]|uniref:Uncharacterized protein n=1 Tax=Eumeta variegata TaxID=151549 RepID=A0A4C1SWG4_EUMVA|nr:hypothetical protein EVAR_72815_1 [Eumeta japonica]